MKSEILAPVGNSEALTAALNCGADAVYFGVGGFNARAFAENFTLDNLEETVKSCHKRGVKVYLTLNTLVNDSEIKEIEKVIERVTLSGVDALILQDLGVAKIVREISPDIKMHASTQMSVQSLYGIERLEKLGFCRTVLPREMNKKEIEYIVKNSPLEIEMFVHGALCMCVSGQCQLSAFLGGRSGNRGRCAQPCRLPFSVEGGTGYDLSLKDLSLIEKLPYLEELGVSSFKIEGRMKRAEYVAGAVTACREALDGKYTEKRKDDLQRLFSRSGFTDGYYENKLGRDMFGTRTDENKSASSKVLDEYRKLYIIPYKKRKVDFDFSAYINRKAVLTASSDDFSITVESEEECEKAVNLPLSVSRVKEQLGKCGNTQFEAGNINISADDNVSVPISVINSLRRISLEKLDEMLSKTPEKRILKKNFLFEKHISKDRKTYLRFENSNQIPDIIPIDKIILPLDTDEEIIKKYNAVIEIPRGIFGSADRVYERVVSSPAEECFCSTLDAVEIALKSGKRVIASPYLNIFNSLSVDECEKMGISEITVSNELSLKQISSLGGKIKRGVVSYGRQALMLVRSCPVKNAKTCEQCKKKSFLTDRKGKKFPVRCSGGCSQIFNSVPLYMADKSEDIKNVDFELLYFTVENKNEVERIIDCYKNKKAPEGEFTRGLLYKGVI
ncbi:MAG: U32 family peptidase [Ruminococcaceae bacterium]|nr:U32 family peptidase [Oscillospiraceae bacterium]